MLVDVRVGALVAVLVEAAALVLVGMALGYDERDIAYHLQGLGSPFSAALFERAREVLEGKDGASGKKKKTKNGGLMGGIFK